MSKIRRGGHSAEGETLSAGRVEYLEAARARVRTRRIRRTVIIVAVLTILVLFATGAVGSSIARAKDLVDTAVIALAPAAGWPQQTGITDPDKLCADLKLRSRISAESALAFWAGAGLLERYEENAAPGAEPSAPAPMRWAEIAAASRTDPMISSLIDCGQTSFARPLTHTEMEKLVNLYVQEGFAPETVMLCVAYVASRGKRTMAAVTHELKVWRAEGVETGEQADAHLKLLALRQSREEYVSSLLQITPEELTLGGRKAIARWYEVYGYDDAMVQEAAVQAGPKRDLWYWNSILKTWNAKGLRSIHDVRGPVAAAGASRNIRVDRAAPSGNDILKNATRRRSLIKKPE